MIDKKTILNKLIELEVVNVVGDTHLLNESFQKKVIQKVKNSNCIINYCLAYPNNSKKGVIPTLNTDAVVINKYDGTDITPKNVTFGQGVYEVDELIAYCEVNNTTLSFNKEGIEEVLSTYFAKSLIKTLNKLAIDELKKVTTNVKEGAYNAKEFVGAISKVCLPNPNTSVILCGVNNVATLDLDINKSPNILGIPVIVLDGIDYIAIVEENALAHVFNESMKIGIDTNGAFRKNKSFITLTSEHGFTALDENSFMLFKYTV